MYIINRLTKIKSIVTIILTALVTWLAITGKISGDQVITIYTAVIGFYFGTKQKEGN